MKIRTQGDTMIAELETGSLIKWVKGSHTANVYSQQDTVDCFTFGWEDNTTSQLDFTEALESYLEWLA
jgi:hypothetical protein